MNPQQPSHSTQPVAPAPPVPTGAIAGEEGAAFPETKGGRKTGLRPQSTRTALFGILLCALVRASCQKTDFSSQTTRTSNGQAAIAKQLAALERDNPAGLTLVGSRLTMESSDGVRCELHARGPFSIGKGRITALAKGGVITIQETGGPGTREAEVREKDGAAELWMKDRDGFRRGTPDEDRWLEGFLQSLPQEIQNFGEPSTSHPNRYVIDGAEFLEKAGRKDEADQLRAELKPLPKDKQK